MRHNKLSLYVHFVWTTWDRLPLIEPGIERELYREIQNEATGLNCKVLALNGTQDHIHLLLEMPAILSISHVMKRIKGASSLFVNDSLQPATVLKWRGSYAAFTVSRWDVPKIAAYIENQKTYHAHATTKPDLEAE